MNNFGGDWTKIKIEILVEYAQAYLKIMNSYKQFKTLYFDGFAGSGFIEKDKKFGVDITVGAAKRIIEIDDPKAFDMYYFVELDKKNFKLLEANTKSAFPKKENIIHVVQEDCNKKLLDLANFLRVPKNSKFRTLAYVDPCGMQVEWRAIESLRNLPIDLWVLVPTGLGVNRLLKKNGQINEEWLSRLELFLGYSKDDIFNIFYKKSQTLFDDIIAIKKEADAIDKAAKLYQNRLKEVFKYVSTPYELKNSSNSIMYHLFLASNNSAGAKIANDIVKKYTT